MPERDHDREPEPEPERVAALLALDERPTWSWTADDLRDLALQLLRSPVRVLLEGLEREGRPVPAGERFEERLEDALRRPRPDLDQLRWIKRAARYDGPGGVLPFELRAVLYHACLFAARRGGGGAITRLEAGEQERGLEWCLARAWLPGPLRQLFPEGRYHHGAR